MNDGGTLLTFNAASEYAIETLKLPVKNVLNGVRNTEFYAPGSIIGVELNKASALTATPSPWCDARRSPSVPAGSW